MVTGGAGFIGSEVVRQLVESAECNVVNIDKLTYAGNLESLRTIENDANYRFCRIDICDRERLREEIFHTRPTKIMHLAAESHVDRSIDSPADFIQTNIVGTYNLLEICREYHSGLSGSERDLFRFHHVSTDEVYGSLGEVGLFTEETPYRPNSPYSASKASSDHLVRAWFRTYGVPTLISNCSNNYGPYQFPEKLIPLVIHKALVGEPIPIYGKGENVRDWLYVSDHARALRLIIKDGEPGQVYNVGGNNEITNLEVVKTICAVLDQVRPSQNGVSYEEQIAFVQDRPGHDLRYAIDAGKIKRTLNWSPNETFESGIRKTVTWYLDNQSWCESVMRKYRGERLGVGV